eukprot:1002937-Prymnesium_polylepis.1
MRMTAASSSAFCFARRCCCKRRNWMAWMRVMNFMAYAFSLALRSISATRSAARRCRSSCQERGAATRGA